MLEYFSIILVGSSVLLVSDSSFLLCLFTIFLMKCYTDVLFCTTCGDCEHRSNFLCVFLRLAMFYYAFVIVPILVIEGTLLDVVFLPEPCNMFIIYLILFLVCSSVLRAPFWAFSSFDSSDRMASFGFLVGTYSSCVSSCVCVRACMRACLIYYLPLVGN